MTPEERLRLLDRLQEAEENLDRAMRCIHMGKSWDAYWLTHDAHAELRAVRLAMQEEQT